MQRPGVSAPPASTSVPPASSGAKISKTDRSKSRGVRRALAAQASSAEHRRRRAQRSQSTAPGCVTMARPWGCPVEPEV